MKRRLSIAILVVLFAGLEANRNTPASPPPPGIRLVDDYRSPVQAVEGFSVSDSRGLFVGVRSFSTPESASQFNEVAFAVDDAVDMAYFLSVRQRLIEPGNVTLCLSGETRKPESGERLRDLRDSGAKVLDAKQDTILSRLKTLSQEVGPGGVFVGTFASHGFNEKGNDYFVAANSIRGTEKSPGIPIEDILFIVQKAEILRPILFVDACRSQLNRGMRAGEESRESLMSPAFADAIAKSKGLVVFTAARAGGYAFDDFVRQNGVFTAAVLDGLSGKAASDGRGFITPSSLLDYTQKAVCNWVRKNRSAEVGRCGVTYRIDGGAREMPLALDMKQRATQPVYAFRRDLATIRLCSSLNKIKRSDNAERIRSQLPNAYPTNRRQRSLIDDLFHFAEEADTKSPEAVSTFLDRWEKRWKNRDSCISEPESLRLLRGLQGQHITVRLADDSEMTDYCGCLETAGLHVACDVWDDVFFGSTLTLNCPYLETGVAKSLESFFDLHDLKVVDYRKKHQYQPGVCLTSSSMILEVGYAAKENDPFPSQR